MKADGSSVFDPSEGWNAFEKRFEIDRTIAGTFAGKVFDKLSREEVRTVRSLQGSGLVWISAEGKVILK